MSTHNICFLEGSVKFIHKLLSNIYLIWYPDFKGLYIKENIKIKVYELLEERNEMGFDVLKERKNNYQNVLLLMM